MSAVSIKYVIDEKHMIKFWLLTHPREINKKHNTGRIVLNTLNTALQHSHSRLAEHQLTEPSLGDNDQKFSIMSRAEVIIWQRTEPDKQLLPIIEQGTAQKPVWLLYPEKQNTDDIQSVVNLVNTPDNWANAMSKNTTKNIILIDGTWQEAQKIYNKSKYLHDLPRISLTPNKKSIYRLRRNQVTEGLCTAECVAEILNQCGAVQTANQLMDQLNQFISSYPKH